MEETFGSNEWKAIVGHNQNSPIVTSPGTGFGWGAYVAIEIADNTVIMNSYVPAIQFVAGGNQRGSYIYTIFDENGGNNPTETLDMTTGKMTITISGGTGYPQGFKVLVRDANGEWYLGGALEVNNNS